MYIYIYIYTYIKSLKLELTMIFHQFLFGSTAQHPIPPSHGTSFGMPTPLSAGIGVTIHGYANAIRECGQQLRWEKASSFWKERDLGNDII